MIGLVVLAAPETYEAAVIVMLITHRRIHLSFRRERDHEVINRYRGYPADVPARSRFA
jgi:hypothetical protein